MNKKHSKNNSKDQRRSKDTKWVRPKGYYCRYERERRGEGKRITEPLDSEPKPSSPYSTTSTSPGLRPGNA